MTGKDTRVKDLILRLAVLYSVMYTGNNFLYAEQTPLRIFLTSFIETCVIIGVDYVWGRMARKKKDSSK